MDTRLITYFTGDEVEVLRWLLESQIRLLEELGYDLDRVALMEEMLSRIP